MRPNIVWLISEDLSPTGAEYGDMLARTPAMDRIAREGVVFENGFSTAPVCAPSRFSLVTGMYPTSCGPAHHMSANAHVPEDVPSYPVLLREAGYYAVNFSKADYNCDLDLNVIWDDRTEAAHWRNRPEGKPFFACFNIIATHESSLFREEPTYVTPDEVTLPPYLPDTPAMRRDFARYYTARTKTDDAFARILAELEEDGLLESTIVIHTSDHGGSEPRTKRFCYDEGLRVPFVFRIPEAFAHLSPWPAGSRVTTATSEIDIAPTILALAGVGKPPTMQGRALLGNEPEPMLGLAFGGRDRMDICYDMVRTVRDDRYRYIRNYSPHRIWGQYVPFMFEGEGYRSWLEEHMAGRLSPDQDRFWQTKPAEEFYDQQVDRHSLHNLIDAPEHQERIAAMRAALHDHMVATNDNGLLPEGSPLEGYHESRNAGALPVREVLALADQAITRDPARVHEYAVKLSDANEAMRWWAAQALLMLGTEAAPAIVALRSAVHDESPMSPSSPRRRCASWASPTRRWPCSCSSWTPIARTPSGCRPCARSPMWARPPRPPWRCSNAAVNRTRTSGSRVPRAMWLCVSPASTRRKRDFRTGRGSSRVPPVLG